MTGAMSALTARVFRVKKEIGDLAQIYLRKVPLFVLDNLAHLIIVAVTLFYHLDPEISGLIFY
jgi:hypothetical protein